MNTTGVNNTLLLFAVISYILTSLGLNVDFRDLYVTTHMVSI